MTLRSQVTAVLGPTNTGKTHLAVERLCAHASGMIGFPLRLLAREVYDRVVAAKGAAQVALVTGEEKILPANPRYWLCTAESMPADVQPAFVALDEAQMGADPERGHVFTDRLLHARGTAETMILGAETLRPLVRRLLPDAEIVARPRFSTLSHVAPRKLSRLPVRSAIVAFNAEEVYAIAEMLRRMKGGAAVVMGSLSPRTRNAQVQMFQNGEVDYLVATDAVGMGLNMDVAHVAFAGLSKFDGRKRRRLTPAEMAQIAGRAGRYHRDGTFGTVALGEDAPAFTEDEVARIENHEFQPLRGLFWRNARLDYSSLHRLVASLDALPSAPELTRGDDAIDVAVLKKLAGEPWVMERARGPAALRRLWAACGVPDYRKLGHEQHARLVARMYRHLSEGEGHLPPEWVASELAVLDNVAGDIATLSDRIAGARTWTYATQRADWLADSAGWAERARAVEDKLSDALHQRLTQRFVDRRTSVLLRGLGVAHAARVEVDPDGSVVVDGEIIGTLEGFRFTPDPAARAGEKRMLLAAAERRLGAELARRAGALAADEDAGFALGFDGGMPPRIEWRGARVATLRRGKDALNPRLELDRPLGTLEAVARAAVLARLEAWFAAQRGRHLAALTKVARLEGLSAPARGLVVQLVETLGALARPSVENLIADIGRDDRRALAAAGVRLGVSHVFVGHALKPEATRWRLALWGVWADVAAMPAPPQPGRVALAVDRDAPPGFYEVAGFWRVDGVAVRVDMADRLARELHAERLALKAGSAPFVPAQPWQQTLGLPTLAFARVVRALGFRAVGIDGKLGVAWAGGPRQPRNGQASRPAAASPFAKLAGLIGG